MSHIEKVIPKLNEKQRTRLDNLRKVYKNAKERNIDKTRASAQISAYLRGLTDADAITEADFRALFIYYTI